MLGGRIPLRQLTPARLLAAAGRRWADLPHRRAWHAPSGLAAQNRARLAAFADRHAGQRCFVLCNGPSLAKMDLEPLRDEVTFGLNRIYLLFDELGFSTTYYCAVNALVIGQFARDIATLPMPKFLNWTLRHDFPGADDNTLFVRNALGLRDFFATDPRRSIASGGTVTYTALQLAYYMGFSQVVLLGADHRYAERGTPNRIEVRGEGDDSSHFHPEYFPSGARWQLPDLTRSELAYALARDAYAAAGREILNATVGGSLDVFPKVEFESLFEE